MPTDLGSRPTFSSSHPLCGFDVHRWAVFGALALGGCLEDNVLRRDCRPAPFLSPLGSMLLSAENPVAAGILERLFECGSYSGSRRFNAVTPTPARVTWQCAPAQHTGDIRRTGA